MTDKALPIAAQPKNSIGARVSYIRNAKGSTDVGTICQIWAAWSKLNGSEMVVISYGIAREGKSNIDKVSEGNIID